MLNDNQYATSKNYEARLYLNQHFRTNRDSKAEWLFSFFPKKENLRILELGCGTGLFWLAIKALTPQSWDITLSDYSEGMLNKTKEALSSVDRSYNYATINAQNIDFTINHFDVILANNMLYHIGDLKTALSQIKGVLNFDGVFIASTQGKNDMKELNNIVYSYMVNKGTPHIFKERSFSMNNGFDQLRPFFDTIKVKRFDYRLEITEIEPIINYFLSFNGITNDIPVLPEEKVEGFRLYLQTIMDKDKAIVVNKETGAFICSNT
jgi:ubiquinone/menaquinone biosynthesis C-methylase UbiE